MVKSESKGKKDPKGNYSKRSDNDASNFEDYKSSYRGKGKKPARKGASRYSGSRESRDIERTKVICSACGDECEVPFKPTSNKPVYCDKCFSKDNKGRDNSKSVRGPSRDFKPVDNSKDFEVIKEKLNKIMAALKIE